MSKVSSEPPTNYNKMTFITAHVEKLKKIYNATMKSLYSYNALLTVSAESYLHLHFIK